jgi:hypothetical protein
MELVEHHFYRWSFRWSQHNGKARGEEPDFEHSLHLYDISNGAEKLQKQERKRAQDLANFLDN